MDVDYDLYLGRRRRRTRTRRGHVPAFGGWEYSCSDGGGAVVVDDLPFTQCFESARLQSPGGLYPLYSSSTAYVTAGDLYQNDVVTPAMIVVSRPRHRGKEQGKDEKEKKKKTEEEAVKVTERPKLRKMDGEDLYKISPELIHTKHKRRWKTARLFLCCLLPTWSWS